MSTTVEQVSAPVPGPGGAARARGKTAEWLRAILVGFGMALVGGLFAVAFLWPMTTAQPRDIALAVAGPEQARAGIEQALSTQQAGLFDVTSVDTRDEAVAAIETREASGAVVVGADGVEVLTATGGGPQVAQLLTQMATGLQAQLAQSGQQTTVTVTDVVPGGTGSSAANLTLIPALIAGLAGSVVALLLVRRPYMRAATILTSSVTAGLLGALILGPWFDILPGSYWRTAAAIAMGALAIGAFVTGMGSLFGKVGLALGAVITVLFGNPWGGMLIPSEFLEKPWGTIGSYLPNGTYLHLVRSVNYFPNAATGSQWLILALWVVFGFGLVAVGSVLHHRRTAPTANPEPATA
jgi:hypothetical protein